jgi:hypothetical protein
VSAPLALLFVALAGASDLLAPGVAVDWKAALRAEKPAPRGKLAGSPRVKKLNPILYDQDETACKADTQLLESMGAAPLTLAPRCRKVPVGGPEMQWAMDTFAAFDEDPVKDKPYAFRTVAYHDAASCGKMGETLRRLSTGAVVVTPSCAKDGDYVSLSAVLVVK